MGAGQAKKPRTYPAAAAAHPAACIQRSQTIVALWQQLGAEEVVPDAVVADLLASARAGRVGWNRVQEVLLEMAGAAGRFPDRHTSPPPAFPRRRATAPAAAAELVWRVEESPADPFAGRAQEPPGGAEPEEDNGRECIVCMERPRATVWTGCGHVLCCAGCAAQILTGCPLCGAPGRAAPLSPRVAAAGTYLRRS
eukprot:TRINITY_DN19250_c0_g1_i1.p1 TRINITY_DN19250_c0_g1~~TRINITY_DN19250_c0_g1_i1.p1  ORF type:complete len:196 (+),score=27.03 TRINITY_DN19250_c0_g1_i1:110-697(+)